MAQENHDAKGEAELAKLPPRDQALVRRVLEDHPLLSIEEAIEMLKAFGGL
jgi:hypothetical protein